MSELNKFSRRITQPKTQAARKRSSMPWASPRPT
jgi:hypothetical protein